MNNAKTNEHHEWITVANAARILDVSKQAIRQRIYRDTIPHRKAPDGTVYVRITEHTPEINGETNGDIPGLVEDVMRERIDELKDRIGFVERQLEREQAASRELRVIISQLSQRVPELEAAPEPRDGPERGSEPLSDTSAPHDKERPQERRSWLYRFFFGP